MEEAVKQKKPSSGAYYVRIIGTLFAITAVVAVLLALVNLITAPTIEKRAAEKKADAMAEVMPDCEFTLVDPLPEGVEGVLELQEATSGGAVKGYCVQVETNGFGGALELMVGIDADGVVTGVSILSHSETLNTDKHGELIARYAGSSGEVALTKDGGSIEAISGATVTSRAVTRGVNSALAAVKAYTEGGAK